MVIHKSLLGDLPPLPPANIHAILFERADQANLPDYVLQIDAVTGEKRTRSEFLRRVTAAATALAAETKDGGLALGGGEKVGIFSDNTLDYAVLVHACIKLAVPFVLMSTYSTLAELEYLIRTSHASRIFVHPSLLPLAVAAFANLGLAQDRIYTLGERGPTGRTSLADLTERTKALPPVRTVSASKDTLAYIVFSSGTTGPPKAAMISHGNVVSTMAQTMVWAMANGIMASPTNFPVLLAFLPWYHSYGFIINLIRAMAVPATSIVLPRWDLDLVADSIERYKVDSLPLIPSVIPQIIASERFRKADLSSLETVAFGASHLTPTMFEKLREIFGQKFVKAEGYGLSEATMGVISSPNPAMLGGKLQIDPAAKGILNPGLEVRIVRSDGTDAGFDEPGELYVRGSTIFLGYYGNEQATKAAFSADGWLKTGDIFKVDKHGNYFFEDREKDTLKVSGSQVSPLEIEQVLLAHPSYLATEACVAGVPSMRQPSEKVPRAWVVLSESAKAKGSQQCIQELEQFVKQRLSRYKWLRGGIEVVEEIPKLPTGKTLRRVLVDQYNAQRGVSSKL